MRFRAGASSDVGRVREGNEDAYTARDPLFAVADGMGGHQGGEVASRLALETLEKVGQEGAPDGDSAPHLAEVIREANRAVLERASTDPGLQGMGTTLTAVLAGEGRVYLAHVGDSRAYLLRDGSLSRLTKDHTVVERLVEQGRLTPEEAEIHPQRHIVTNALGVDREIQVDEATHEIRGGDRLLLCSDGLTGMISEEDIARILAERDDPQAAADALVEAANAAGGQDNITAVVLDAEDEQAAVDTAAVAVESLPAPDASRGLSTPARMPPGAGGAGRRWILRVLVWVVVPLALVAGALFAVKELFVDSQWFVGVHEGNVALYQGIPAEPLGISLATLQQETGLPAEDIRRFAAWQDLDAGITADSREDADRLIDQMRQDLEDQRAAEERKAEKEGNP